MPDPTSQNTPDSNTRAALVNRQPVTALAAQFEHNLAVVVGINRYQRVRELKTARPDAERLAALLDDPRRDSHDRYQVTELYDEQASFEALSELLFTTLPAQVQAAGPRTRVLFYFAGHGDAEDSAVGLKGFLFPQNAQPDDEATLLPMGLVQQALSGLQCQHVLIILDCCSAGALPKQTSSRSALRPPPLYWDYLQRYVSRKARQVITSAAHNQQALDVSNHRLGLRDVGEEHSPFAQALFEALDPERAAASQLRAAGRYGVVTATDLYQYVSDALYRRVGDTQTPGLWTVSADHDQGEFVFLLPGTRLELAPAPDLTRPEHDPWPPMSAYGADQAGLFAGRDREIQEVARLVTAEPLVVVTGSSAAGKSSLVQAGLLPWLQEETGRQPDQGEKAWHVLPSLTLGSHTPTQALISHVSQALGQPSDPDQAASALAAVWMRSHPGQRLLLAVDLAETLFAPAAQIECARLMHWLAEAAQQDGLHIVLTLRGDHWLVAAAAASQGRQPLLPAATRYELGLMNPDSLRQVIEQPAAARMIYLTPPDLTDALAAAFEGEPAALPLLSALLHRMYLRYADAARAGLRNDRTLTQADYQAVGGVEGLVADLAERFCRDLPDDAHLATLQHVLLRLVDVQEGRYVRRRAWQEEFDYPDAAATDRACAVINGLTACGLVVQSANAEERPYVELGHIALVQAWPRLRGWLLDAGAHWGLQRELTPQAARWATNQEKADLWDDDPRLPQVEETLWPTEKRGKGLLERLRWEKRVLFPPKNVAPAPDAWVNGAELEFVRESVRERSGFRQKLFGAVTVFVVVVFLLSGLALWQRGVALENERIALEKQEQAEREAHRAKSGELAVHAQNAIANNRDDPSLALLLAIQAVETTWNAPEHIVTVNADAALRAALDVAPPYRMTLPRHRHSDSIFSAAYSSDGQRIVTASGDGTARIWDAATGQEIRQLRGHTDRVRFAAFSPDGQQVVTNSDDGTARTWDSETGQEVHRLLGHTGSVSSAAYSPDGHQIVTAGSDQTARIWDAETGLEMRQLRGHTGAVSSVAYSPDGQQIVTASVDETARVWDSTTGQVIHQLRGHAGSVNSAVYSPDGQLIVTSSGDETARIWSATTGEAVRQLLSRTRGIESAVFSPDSQFIVTASYDGTAHIWNVETGQQVQLLAGHTGTAWSAVYSPDGQFIITASDDQTARIWDAVTGAPVRTLSGHTDSVLSATYNPDGQRIVSASGDGTALIWDAVTGAPVLILSGHSNPVWSAVYSPDGKAIVTASEDGTARIWNAATGQEVHQLRGHEGRVFSAAYSPDGLQIVTAGNDETARIWDAATGQELRQLGNHVAWIARATFSPSGKQIVTAGDLVVYVWDATTGKELRQLRGHTDSVQSAVYSPDGRQIVTASSDRTVRIWDATTGQELRQLLGHTAPVMSAIYSRDGQFIVSTSSDQTARIWNAATGQQVRELRGHGCGAYDNCRINSAAYSPDGKQIITASGDRTVRIWDAATGHGVRQLQGHIARIWSADYSSDGQQIVTASYDGTARIWNVETGQQVHRLDSDTNNVNSAAFSPDGRHIVTTCDDEIVRTWSVETGLEVRQLLGHTASVLSGVYSRDGQFIVSASADQTARIWDVTTGQEVHQLRGHTGRVNSAAYSPDDRQIVTASDDGTARIWNVATGKEVRQLSGHNADGVWSPHDRVWSAAFSPDGLFVATAGDDGMARIWNAATGQEVRQLRGHTRGVNSANFSPDGLFIVTAGDDGTARIWNATTAQEVRQLRGHTRGVLWAAYSPDGQQIVTAGYDGLALIWLADIDDLLTEAYRLIQRDPPELTPEDRRQYGLE